MSEMSHSDLTLLQAALAADEDDAQPSGRDFDDTASEASSAVGGMSAYGGSTTTGASSVTGSSGRPASTVGGKKPHKRKQKKVRCQKWPAALVVVKQDAVRVVAKLSENQ